MDNESYIHDRIIIAPLPGKVIVSEDINAVTIEGTDKLQGYALKGAWVVESEDDLMLGEEWYWASAWHSPSNMVGLTPKDIDSLNRVLKQRGGDYAVLAQRQDGRHHFMELRYMEITDQINHETYIIGRSPYSLTRFDGEVEVMGNLTDLLPKQQNQ